jgi:hypothetical protein
MQISVLDLLEIFEDRFEDVILHVGVRLVAHSAPQSNANFPTPFRGRGFVPFGPRIPNVNDSAGLNQS